MKKIFTLIAAALIAAGGVKAQVEEDINVKSGWGWGYNSITTFDENGMTITLTGGYGAGSTGWNDGEDWSKYNKLSVVIESYTNDWGKVYFDDVNGKTVAEKTFSTINSTTTVTVDFEPSSAAAIKQLSIQGKAEGDVIKVSRVYLTESISYETTGTEIPFDQYGNIMASSFEGFSDDAKVVFTYNITGELTNDAGQSIVGWGTGSIASINTNNTANPGVDKVVKVGDVPVKALGDNTVSFSLAELREALEAPADSYGQQGLNWNMYNQGNSKSTRVSVMVYKVADLTMIGNIQAAGVADNNTIYNLAGQKVDKSYKGIVIKNGKKYIGR